MQISRVFAACRSAVVFLESGGIKRITRPEHLRTVRPTLKFIVARGVEKRSAIISARGQPPSLIECRSKRNPVFAPHDRAIGTGFEEFIAGRIVEHRLVFTG